ncbi:MAG TPA: acetylornithine deacetylase [Oleiagrimonas sp.]|nr:acetylornithine deacetylase [Oleiagrimonas sp.]
MNSLLQSTLDQLRALVAHDTRNPPREIDTDGIFAHAREQLPDFDITMTDHGAGAVSMLAVRGQPKYLFNVHLDTVPAAPAWSRDPFELHVGTDRATALGACDIKGAAAALLAVAQATDEPMALLFSSDEEANDTRCIKAFLKAHPATAPRPSSLVPAFEAVIVAEPTQGRAVLAHRGIQSVLMRFGGKAGHASKEQLAGDSALHQAMRWGNAALDFVAAQNNEEFGGLTGLRFNIGRVEGGIKANVIAPDAELRFNMRPLPSMGADDLLATFKSLAIMPPVEFTETFRGPSLPSGDPSRADERRQQAHDLADSLAIPVGPAVDFWTEAALFSAAGYTTFVYGPGDIAQAHAADEWVALDQLQSYVDTIHHIVASGQA